MSTIHIPTPLRPYTEGNSQVVVAGNNVGTALTDLIEQYPALRQHLFDGEALRQFVNIYLYKEDIRYLDGQQTPLQPDDILRIIPSIAGG